MTAKAARLKRNARLKLKDQLGPDLPEGIKGRKGIPHQDRPSGPAAGIVIDGDLYTLQDEPSVRTSGNWGVVPGSKI
jgi:hypothetical protein